MRRQEGQVLPLGLALLAFGVLGALVLFNTGQIATDKMKLANTADAAAFSGTLWQARALNFQSYTNRAMVANQVSIAQAVSLQSWVSYGAVTSENIATVLKPVPVINVVSEGLQRGLDIVERVVSPVAQALVSVVDVVNRGLSLSQEAMFVSTFVATPDVIRSVVNETDERFTINTGFSGLGLAGNLNQWRSFTDGFSGDDVAAMDERVQMINDSRDSFSQQRNWKFFSFWFYSTPLLRHQIRREGTTELVRVDTQTGIEWEWKAKDTMSLQNRLWHWKGTKRYEVPIGWAEAFANSVNSNRTIEPGACTTAREMRRKDCARFLGINRHGEYLADIGQRSVQGHQTRTAMRNYTGVQAYRSLSQASIDQEKPRISLKVEVALPVESVKGSDALGSKGAFQVPLDAPGDKLTSISVAEVFYQRPDTDLAGRGDLPLEPANGYNPYWSSRLSAVSSADRLLAFALRGDTGSNVAPTGNGLPDNTVALSNYDESSWADTLPGTTSSTGDSLLPGVPENVRDFNTVAAEQASDGLDQFRRDIEGQLMDALRDQVGNMLASAVSSRLGGNATSIDELEGELEGMAMEQVGELASADAAQPFIEAVNEATAIAEELEAEFRAIRQTIVDGFQESFERVSADMALEVERIEARIQAHRDTLASPALNEDAQRSAQDAISGLSLELYQLRQDFKDELAEELRTVVNESTDLYIMRMDEARYLVGEFLRTEEESIQLPWLEFVEEGDTDD